MQNVPYLKPSRTVAGMGLLLFALSCLLYSCSSTAYLQGSIDGYHETSSGPSYPDISLNTMDAGLNVGMIFMGIPEPPAAYRSSGNTNSGPVYYAAGELDPAYLAAHTGAVRPQAVNKPADNFMSHVTYMGGLEFIQKRSGDPGSTTALNYLEVPLNGIYQTPLLSGSVFGGIGPYVAYGIGGSTSATYNGKAASVSSFNSTSGFKRFDAGLNLTAGYRLPDSFYFNLVYSHGLANIDRNAFGDKTRNAGFSLNVGYPLHKLIKLVHK